MRKAFDAYKKFALKARSTGDNMGRKMIMAPVGGGEYSYDYVYSLYANSPSNYGKNVDNYNENLWDADEANGNDKRKLLFSYFKRLNKIKERKKNFSFLVQE